jgi:hypothetical protein
MMFLQVMFTESTVHKVIALPHRVNTPQQK